MKEFKATQGWRLQEDGVIIDENYNTVADFMVSDLHDLANARLAEKAPEMLEILQRVANNEYVSPEEAKQLTKQATEL